MKKCFKCNTEKPLDEFYKHPSMLDGHLNKCKLCAKSDVKTNYEKNILNKDYVEKERQRGRSKYQRLNYREKNNNKLYSIGKYKNQSRDLKAPKGMECHHWSYKKEFFSDVFVLTRSIHRRIHHFLLLDEDHKCFRCKETLILLDTREKHINFLKSKGYDLTNSLFQNGKN